MLKRKSYRHSSISSVAILALVMASASHAQTVVSEDFTGSANANPWYFFNGACLTSATAAASGNPGTIPSCLSIASSYYNETLVGGNSGYLGSNSAPGSPTTGVADPSGQGALRFTNGSPGGYHQNGAIVSQNTYSTGSGVQVTFKTVTYRGNSGGGAGDGADGISFYLMDGSQPAGIGAWGGSLGYTCSNANPPYNGLIGGYLGLGVDEYGNFLNQGDNTATGFNYVPGRIGLRGAGSVAWSWLHAQYPTYYPNGLTSAEQQASVQHTCHDGVLWDYSNDSSPKQAKVGVNTVSVADYLAIPNAYKVLAGVKIANEGATTRSQGNVIAYKLKITQDGLLSFQYSYNGGAYQSVLAKQNITTSNGPLPASFRFGFAGSTGGSTNVHEILCFQAAPADTASTSIGINEKEAAKVANGTQAYLAYYYPSTWAGRLTANNLLFNSLTQTLTISSAANWDASCVLTGVAAGKTCPTTGSSVATSAQGSASRAILTWSGAAGIPFEWSSLTTAQQNALDVGDSSTTANRLNYLRGDRTNEVNTAGAGLFRPRDSVLGDIVDSSPTWVGPPSLPFSGTWQDSLYSSSAAENSGTQSYAQYMTSAGTRLNVVYTGSNDGLLHGFRAGSFNGSTYVNNATTPNDGYEVLAYMPGALLSSAASGSGNCANPNATSSVVQNIHGVDPAIGANPTCTDSGLDLSSTQYGHNFFVDATPGTGDLFYSGTWHTWLVGGLGPGGAAIYALDVTDPTQFSEANASSLVIGEWTPSSLTCSNVANCGNNLGSTYGTPVIRRLHNGMWAIIFGNGFGSSSGDAGIYIVTVDPTSGARTFYYLTTNNAGTSDGIAYVYPADLDGDRIIDYIYAGDLNGNIWRFDVTSSSPASWAASSSPLFTTPAGQPITSKLVVWVSPAPAGGGQQLMVDFGTGQKIPVTNSSPAQYASGTQYLYGIWDWNMSSWNSLSGSQYSSLTAPQSVTTSALQTQTLTDAGGGIRNASTNTVCWKGTTTCSGGSSANTQFGWVIALPSSSEQVIYNPIAYKGAFVVNTTIPASNAITSCSTNTDSGYTLFISATSGGAIPNLFKNYNDMAGLLSDGTGSLLFANVGGNDWFLTQTVDGNGTTGGVPGGVCPPPGHWSNGVCTGQSTFPGPTGKRLTWIQKR